MARMKFGELAKQTMTPEAIARSQKAAMKEIAAMELAELRDTLKLTQADLTHESFPSRNFKTRKTEPKYPR